MSIMHEILRIAGTESLIWPLYRTSANVPRPFSPLSTIGATPVSSLQILTGIKLTLFDMAVISDLG